MNMDKLFEMLVALKREGSRVSAVSLTLPYNEFTSLLAAMVAGGGRRTWGGRTRRVVIMRRPHLWQSVAEGFSLTGAAAREPWAVEVEIPDVSEWTEKIDGVDVTIREEP